MLESMEEFEEWKKLKTAVMMEKCRCRNEGVVCPKPRKGYMRYSGENIEAKVGAELSDIISFSTLLLSFSTHSCKQPAYTRHPFPRAKGLTKPHFC
ncbi:uncharacterized protein LOC143879804 isoform X2 [Tasmannia lanceolata]|uniref:uncharacterized protein LOC143879804 isoform X2 n=1 Tax=Tasmannia lanceolata TaxID=3420 RepID=UPI0040647DAB